MTMKFRTLKASIVTLLGDAAAGRFRTIGYQEKPGTGDQVLDSNRMVRVFYPGGEFPQGAGSLSGPMQHDITFAFKLKVAKSNVADIATFNNDASTPAELVTAISTMETADDLVDDAWDEFADIIFQIVMDARNLDLGMATRVANRWVQNIAKDKILTKGELDVLTGQMTMTARVEEIVTGETGTTVESIDMGVDTFSPDEEEHDTVVRSGTLNEY